VDTKLVSRELPLATLDQLVMRSITAPPAQQLPRPSVLAAAVVAAGAPKEAIALSGATAVAELGAAASYTRGGMHDGERTILLREFVQGLVEIAAVTLSFAPVASVGVQPTPPLAQALLDMIQSSILQASPTPAAKAEDGDSGIDTSSRARLELIYGHYAATEPPSRFRKAPLEPMLTVRGYVRVLADAGLLPAGYVASALLAHTLPSYYLVLPELPSSRPAVEAASNAPNLTSMVRPRGGAASANAGAPATENAGDAKMAKAVDAVPVDVDATEMLLNLSLIYAEFEECMIKFAGLHASLSPPWTPLAGEDAGADVEAEAVVDAEVATDAETASAQPSSGDANADFEAQPTDCEGPAPAPPVPINAIATLRDDVLPCVGTFLVERLDRLASVA